MSFYLILSVPIYVLISSSYKDASHIRLESTLITSFYLYYLFKRPYAQIQLHSEVLGERTLTYEFVVGTHNSVPDISQQFPLQSRLCGII